MERSNIRIFLADDHEVVRAGLVRLLEEIDGFSILGAATDGDAALQGRPRTFGQLCQHYIENELRIEQEESARHEQRPLFLDPFYRQDR